MNKTSIEWTDYSANPIKFRDASGNVVWGCVKTSPGCANCYSEKIAERWRRGGPFTAATMRGLTPFLDEAELKAMRTYKPAEGKRCFIGDMTDVFGEWVPDALLDRLFSEVLERRPGVTWQVLTKRADRMQRYLSWRWGEGRIPCRNIHVGVSVEDQARADDRIPLLLQTPAAVRFLSCEPLLGPVRLPVIHDTGEDMPPGEREGWGLPHTGMGGYGASIGWVIVGGESGAGARACRVEWVRSIVDQCKAASVPAFVKQLGSNPRQLGEVIGESGFQAVPELRLKDRKGGTMAEWPEDVRVRQWPEGHGHGQ
jgi:protein gp37